MKDSDTSNKLKRKLMGLLSYNKSAIKWRRSFICSLISTFLIFTLVYFRVPTVKELVLFILIIYIVYYSLWIDFVEKVSNKVEYHGKNIIKHLKS